MNILILLILFINTHESSIYKYTNVDLVMHIREKVVLSSKAHQKIQQNTKVDQIIVLLKNVEFLWQQSRGLTSPLEEKSKKKTPVSTVRPLSDSGNKTAKKTTNQANQEVIHFDFSVKDIFVARVCKLDQKRRQIGNLLQKYVGIEEYPVIEGMLLGGTDQLSRSLKDSVKVSGLSHLLSASGSNVSLLLILYSPQVWRKFGKFFTALISLVFIVAYLQIAGCSAPLVRASLAATVTLFGSLYAQQHSTAVVIALTVVIMLIAQPSYLTDIGFQLSVAATVGIYASTKALPKRKKEEIDTSILYFIEKDWQSNVLTARFTILRQKSKSLANIVFHSCKEVVSLTIAAQLATLPITLYHFQELSIISIVSNAVVLWVVPFIIYGSIITAVVSALRLHYFAVVSGLVSTYCTRYFLIIVKYFSSLSFAQLKLSQIYIYCILFIYLICLLICSVTVFVRKNTKSSEFLCH